MQFSDTSGLTGIVEDITFLLGGITTNEYSLKDRARNVNERYREAWHTIFKSYGGWRFIDDNSNTTPYADQTITSGTQTYPIPTGALTINGVEVKDSSGIWRRVTPITYEEIQKIQPTGEFFKTSNIPEYYSLYEDTIILWPTPNYTQSNSIRVFFDAGISTFASTDTTKTPGFATPYHRVLSSGAALDYAMANGMQEKIVTLSSMHADYIKRLGEFYAERWRDRRPPKIITRDVSNEYK